MAFTDAARARLLDLTHDAILVRRLDGLILFWSRGAEETYGWPAATAVGRVVQDLLQTEFPVSHEHLIELMLRDDRWEGRLRRRRRDGRSVVVETRCVLQRDPEGRPENILEFGNDVTARTEAEDIVRQHHARVNASLRNRDLLLFSQDLDLRYTWVRNAHLGFDDATLVGATDDVLDPKGSAELTAFKRQVLSSGQGGRRQFHVTRGEYSGWFDISVEPVRDEAGRVVGLTGTAFDMTDVRRLEQEALDDQRRTRFVLEATGVGLFDWDLRTGRVNWSPGCSRIFGIENFSGNAQEVIDRIDPSDRERIVGLMPGAMDSGEPVYAEFRIVRPDGEVRWTSHLAEIWHDEHGVPIRQTGVVRDITDRKRAEQGLRALTSREREVLRLIADGKSSREIALILGISVKTAETHRTNLMRKLEHHSISELVRFAVRSRLVEP